MVPRKIARQISEKSAFSLDKLAGIYGAENNVTTENQTIIDTLLVPLAIAAVLHGIYAVQVRALKGSMVTVMKILGCVLFAMFLIQGHRNLMIYLGLSVLALIKYRRPVRLAPFAITVLVSIVGLYMIGIVRNWGWLHLDEVSVSEDAMDPLRGELGASFSVYEKFQQLDDQEPLKFGSTYAIDSVINLVPQQLWRGRPPSPATRFSQAYFGTDNLTEGLGFSPLVESLINFSTFGIPFVFSITAFIFIRVDRWARLNSRVGILISCVLLPTIVNWNRIDFAATEKMFLVYAAFIWGLDKLFYTRAPAGARTFESQAATAWPARPEFAASTGSSIRR